VAGEHAAEGPGDEADRIGEEGEQETCGGVLLGEVEPAENTGGRKEAEDVVVVVIVCCLMSSGPPGKG
jgi:hypothetical protein